MALLGLWRSGRTELADKQVHQILAIAGDGRLRDDNETSREFRAFLAQIPSEQLRRYTTQCLEERFSESGLVLQDLVNEIGGRLGFDVEPGLYRGKPGVPGQDGLWRTEDGRLLVIEVKTSDAYRIRLEKFADQRRALVERLRIQPEHVAGLIVVGRQDTGGLEAQIRGSRFAWDMRLISVDALSHLLEIKESIDDARTEQQIRDLLFPREFTRLDAIVDLVFSTKRDLDFEEAEIGEDTLAQAHTEGPTAKRRRKEPLFTPVRFHEGCVRRVEAALGIRFRRTSRSVFHDPQTGHVLICRIAKTRQRREGSRRSWHFFFSPEHREILERAPLGHVVLGCGSEAQTFLIPAAEFLSYLETMNTSTYRGRLYIRFRVVERNGRFFLHRRRGTPPIDLEPYALGSG